MATGYYLLDHENRVQQYGKTRRGGARASGTIILHDAEGGTDLAGADMGAENVARYICERTTYGSYHDLVDRDTHIPMAPIDYETWHSVPDNPWSVGISVAWNKADLARMTSAQRRSYYVPLARVVLLRRAEFARRGITVPIDRMLTASETQARKPGISTHSRTDPSRRSDPFGTGSSYEAEFLAVLRELAKTNTTNQEDDMSDFTATDRTMLSEIHQKLLRKFTDGDSVIDIVDASQRTLAVARRTEADVNELHSGEFPKIDKTAQLGGEKITLRTAIKETRLAVLGTSTAAITTAVTKALEGTTGVDKAAIDAAVAAVVDAIEEAVAGTEYVLTPKEQ